MPHYWPMDGYGCKVDLEGDKLTMAGTNRATKTALLGEHWEQGSVTLARSEIASVAFKPAKLVTNGALTVHATSGRKYIAHFLKKHNDGFADLARQLGASV